MRNRRINLTNPPVSVFCSLFQNLLHCHDLSVLIPEVMPVFCSRPEEYLSLYKTVVPLQCGDLRPDGGYGLYAGCEGYLPEHVAVYRDDPAGGVGGGGDTLNWMK